MAKFWVVDTNALVSALLLKDSISSKALLHARQTGILLTCPEISKEYFRILTAKKFDKYVSIAIRYEFLYNVLVNALTVEITKVISVCRDPNDNIFLSLAVSAGAEAIISGDNDLLTLNPFEGIPIINPKEFIDKF
jgi:uncharacterized protein